MIFFFSITMAFSISVLLLLANLYFRKKSSTDIFQRIRRHNADDEQNIRVTRETLWETFLRIIKRIAEPFKDKNWFEPLDLKLKRAKISLTGVEYVTANLIAMITVGILIYMVTINRNFSIAVAFFVPVVIWAVVLYYFQKHKNAFTEQLGDCLITIADALRAGYSFQQAMEVVAKEMKSPISQEFIRTSNDVKMGMSLEDALEQMNSRVDSADFTLVVTAVLVQREVGGNLAQILDTISDTIMERIRMKREINSLTAQGRLSSIILLILPFALGIATFIVNPDQTSVFFEETIGKILLIVSIIMDIIGFIIIQRIVNIET